MKKLRDVINRNPVWTVLTTIILGLGTWLLVNVSNSPKVYAEKKVVQNIASEMRQGFRDINKKIDRKQEILQKKIDTNQNKLNDKIDKNQRQLINLLLKKEK